MLLKVAHDLRDTCIFWGANICAFETVAFSRMVVYIQSVNRPMNSDIKLNENMYVGHELQVCASESLFLLAVIPALHCRQS